MTLEDGMDSLKLQCALNDYGFIILHDTVLAKCNNYFIRPIGMSTINNKEDDLFGFQYAPPSMMIKNFEMMQLWLPFASTAKLAISKCLDM